MITPKYKSRYLNELGNIKNSFAKNRSQRIPQRQTIIIPAIWKRFNIPLPIPEYMFCLERKYRIDYAWPQYRRPLAVEIEGGIWTKGRHITPKGFLRDMEKYNLMTERGWILLRYEPNGIDFIQIKKTLENNSRI